MEPKPELRRRILVARDTLSPAARAARSAQAGEHLFSAPEVAAAGTLMFFASFGGEIATRPMLARALAQGKRLALPRVDRASRRLAPHLVRDPEAELAPGFYGIPEPRPESPLIVLDDIEVVIVPGVAWGEDGFRVGYGGGFYDRFLPTVPQARRVGLAFELQVLPSVPHGAHDLPVHLLVTEAGVRRFPPA